MDLDGEYFIFDWCTDLSEGVAFAVMRVEKGSLVECFHPDDYSNVGTVGPEEDELAIRYLKRNNIMQAHTIRYPVEYPNRFLGRILWHREELTDPNLAPGQWSFYHYAPLNEYRRKELKRHGIEVIVIDADPYITKDNCPVVKDRWHQLGFKF